MKAVNRYILTGFIAALFALATVWVCLSQRHIDNGEILRVAGVSMQPTLNPGDKVRLIRVTDNTYQRGDLVAVSFKTRKRMMVKRIIAIAGDEVLWRDERVYVNGEPLVMDGWPENRRVSQRSWKLLGIQLKKYQNHIPKNNVIVMGDNVRNSYDSGDFGMLSLDQISGYIHAY